MSLWIEFFTWKPNLDTLNMDNGQNTPKRWWDLPAAALLLAALETSATRLVSTRWTSDLSNVQTLAFFGVIAGLALGQSRFSLRLTRLLALAYALFFVPWQLGITIRDSDLLWGERLAILANRLAEIVTQIVGRQQVQDSLLFLVLTYSLFWALAIHAGHCLTREGNPWKSILPAGLALFVIHSFDALIASRVWFITVYLFFALSLVGRLTYLQHHRQWKEQRAALPPNLGVEFIRFTLATAFLVLIFAWSTPALAQALPAAQKAWEPVRQNWEKLKKSWEDAFAPLRGAIGVTASAYGPSAMLGLGSTLPENEVFTVKTPPGAPTTLRFYWRARTYDTYNSGQWYSTINRRQNYRPLDTELQLGRDDARWAGSFEIFTISPLATFMVPSQPLWLNRPGQIEFAENPDGTIDLSVIRPTPALKPGQIYNVQSAIINATEVELRQAGLEYPNWILGRYLQLPDTITPRTRQLAAQITAGLDNPYDKAVAITNYLRQNYNYVETLEKGPPADQEAIDWFLFDARQGFCNYYSTAQIVLLRSIDIPARWAVGYAEGEYAEIGLYTVRQKDSHAWPEVYFPGFGWVEFEPTASQPEIARLPGESIAQNQDSFPPENDLYEKRLEYEEQLDELEGRRPASVAEETGPKTQSYLFLVSFALLLAASAFYLTWYYRRYGALPAFLANWSGPERRRLPSWPIILERTFRKVGLRPPATVQAWASRAALPPLSRAYLEVNEGLKRVGQPPAEALTPRERAKALEVALPPAGRPAHQLVDEYIKDVYSKQDQADLDTAQQAAQEIRQLSLRAQVQRFLSRFQQEPPSHTHP